MSNKITCLDTDNTTTISYLTQWDINRKIHISKSDINITNTAPEVHFSNNDSEGALVTNATIVGDYVELEVPNILLQEGYPIFIYIYVWTEETSARTTYELKIPVRARKKPTEYVFQDNVLYVIGVVRNDSVTMEKLHSDLRTKISDIDDKLPLSGGTMTGNIDMDSHEVNNVSRLSMTGDAWWGHNEIHALKKIIMSTDTGVAEGINMSNSKVYNLATPEAATDAASKGYVDENVLQQITTEIELADLPNGNYQITTGFVKVYNATQTGTDLLKLKRGWLIVNSKKAQFEGYYTVGSSNDTADTLGILWTTQPPSTTAYYSIVPLTNAIQTMIDGKENLYSRVTEVNANSDNNHYPTALAVQNAIQAALYADEDAAIVSGGGE